MRFLKRLKVSPGSKNKTVAIKMIIIWLIAALSLPTSLTLADSPGDLDPTFGSEGIVITTLSGAFDEFNAVALQSDGKIVAVGSAVVGGYSEDFLVARYNSDGTLDSTFGNGGIATLSFGDFSEARAVAIQSDGKIVVTGGSPVSLLDGVILVRYNSDGTLDTSFDSDGIISGGYGSSEAVAIQNDGKIVVAGRLFNGSGDFALARYNSDGSLDTTFDNDGFVETDLGSSGDASAYAIAIQSDGKLVVAGESNDDFALARYNSDGSLDTTFDSDGLVTTDIADDIANDIAIQSDGKIVVAGDASGDMALARYNNDGSLDSAFGVGGTQTLDISTNDRAQALAFQSDGKIIVGGTTVTFAANDTGLALLRLNGDGSPDTTFGSGGITTIDTTNDDDAVNNIVIQGDDKIVGVGQSGIGSTGDSVVARFNSNGVLDTTFGTTGIVTTAIGIPAHYAKDAAMQADGKILVTGGFFTSVADFVVVRYNGDGSLDTTFDNDGVVITDLGDNDNSSGIAIQNDGKFVVAGDTDDLLSAPNSNFVAARYNTNGSLDPSFGTGGVVTTDLGNSDYVNTIALQSDGRIILAGESASNIALARYNSDGSLDSTFGSSGIVSTDLGDNEYATAIALQSDGKIVVAVNSEADSYDFVLIRYNPDGSLDTTFDIDGIVITDLDLGGSADAVSLQSDGKIVAAGNYVNGYPIGDFAVVRYNSDGSPDPSFGIGGIVTTDLGGDYDNINTVAIQGDAKIVVAGARDSVSPSVTGSDFAIVRYNSDGTLDTSFGTNGIIVTEIGDGSSISRVLLQNDGNIVAVGDSSLGFTVARYLNDSDNITSVSPTTGGTLQQPSTGLSGTVGLTLTVPGGAVTEDTTLVFSNQSASGNPTTGFGLGGIVFTLEAFVNNVEQPNFTFNTPATLTFTYSDADVAGLPGGEASLELRYWTGSAWSTDGITKVSHDVDANTITFQITHLTEFALLGPPVGTDSRTYLPSIVK